MKFINIFLIVAIILNFNFLKADEIKTENKIAKNLRCLICQGQSVYDSDSEFAISLKLVIKNKIQQGYKFLAYGDDMVFISEKFSQEQQNLKQLLNKK